MLICIHINSTIVTVETIVKRVDADKSKAIRWFSDLRMHDVPEVVGKNASLGEMISNLTSLGIKVPDGFATTAEAYREFLAYQGLDDKINAMLDELDVDDVSALVEAGGTIRELVMAAPLPESLENDIRQA